MAQYGALLSHLVTMETRVPVQHFFDGFRTSHEVNKVKLLNYDTIKDLIDWDRVRQHHELALHPRHPHMSGGTRPPGSSFWVSESFEHSGDPIRHSRRRPRRTRHLRFCL